MKPPKTDAEWDAFLDADERELATARNEAEYEESRGRIVTRARFRNVDADPAAPVDSWPLEGLRAVLERGDLDDYRRIAQAIRRDPWGPVARRVEQVLGSSQPYGVTPLMRRAVARARTGAESSERAWVQAELAAALERSGLTRREFADRLGTSTSRLSTYLTGRVVPAATLLARAARVADRAS